MKNGKILFQTLAVVMASALLMAGCGSEGNNGAATAAQYNSASAPQAASDTMAAGGAFYGEEYAATEGAAYDSGEVKGMAIPEENGSASVLPRDRKLIRTVELEMETREFDRMMSELETQVQDLGGYIENLETFNGSSYSVSRAMRWADLTIRIPEDSLNGFLQNVSEIGNVVRRSDSVEDVTLTYVDMESHRDTLKAEQARLLELLEQAADVEDMIALEERLSNVRYCLESMESKLRTMDTQVDYSTVYLNLSEVKELTPVEERTDLQRIGEGFADSVKAIGNSFREGIIWFVIHIPYLVIWVAVIAVMTALLKKYRKKRSAGRAAKAEKKEEEKSAQKG